jgi:hypothetical protein
MTGLFFKKSALLLEKDKQKDNTKKTKRQKFQNTKKQKTIFVPPSQKSTNLLFQRNTRRKTYAAVNQSRIKAGRF